MKNFIKSGEHLISFGVALIPSILLWIFQPTDTVSYSAFAISLLLNLLFLWLFLKTLYDKKENSIMPTIQIIEYRENILICKPNKLLSQDAFVSLYLNTDNFEKLVAYGFVSNVQTNGIIQISISETVNEFTLSNGNDYLCSHLTVKPTVTMNYISKKIREKENNIYE